jgi:membrane protease YdiL (CAAX protease family)
MTTTTAHSTHQGAVHLGPDPLRNAAWFVGITLALAALASVALIGSGAQPTLLAFALAFPPALVAIALAWREGNGAIGRLFHQLTIRPKNPIWFLALLIPLGAFLAVDVVAIASGAAADGMFDDVFPNVLIVPLIVVVPAFAEEIAWRGYALPRTLTAISPLRAAIVLGIPWALIHVPLFLPGQMNSGSSIVSMAAQIVSYSVILTWVYVGTGGSVLMTGLVHALANGLVPLMNGFDPFLTWDIRGIVFPVVAILIVALGGFRRLGWSTRGATAQRAIVR